MEEIKKNQGITLVALIITIIVMLILLTVVVTGTINGELFGYAKKAKDNTEISNTKENIENAYIMAQGTSRYGTVSEIEFQKSLDKIMGENETEVIENGDVFVVKIGERYYSVDKKGKISDPIELTPIEYAGDITKNGTCTGTESNPYKIECIEDLVALSENVQKGNKYNGKYIVLTTRLDFKSIFSYSDYKAKYRYDETFNAYVQDENSQTTIQELCLNGNGFIPIGSSIDSTGNPFRGTFNGQGYEIQNIYINTSNYAALFGGTYYSTIKNLGVTGSITSTEASAYGIGRTGPGCTIVNCWNKANIDGYTDAAGVAYKVKGVIKDCYNTGKITAHSGTAYGVVAWLESTASVDRCRNLGDITSYGRDNGTGAAGVCGTPSDGKIVSNCLNTGKITARKQ